MATIACGWHSEATLANLAHEAKKLSGAMSASIPWGEAINDESEMGGYHLVL